MVGRQAAGALTLALTGGVLGSVPAAGDAGTGGCEVRRMSVPEGIGDGRVMDIEVVPGLGAVYYGSYEVPEEDLGMTQRAVVWLGADAEPVQVGPAGTLRDIGFELTSSGLINGQSDVEVDGEVRVRPWVQDLRSGRLTWINPGDDATDDHYLRRINDRGEVAGTVYFEGFSADARIWLRPGKEPWRSLDGGDMGYAEGWDITNHRTVAGLVAHDTGEYLVPKGVIWGRDGAIEHVLASNPGVEHDTFPRLLNEAGTAAGGAWYGDFFEGHFEAAVWSTPHEITSLGILPGGGYSEVYGQSEGGWVVGLAEHYDPEHPAATPWGAVEHSFLWAGETDAMRVLPSPWAVEHGLTDWHDWVGGAAHGAHTALDQVGTMSHGGWHEDGAPQLVPTLFLNASSCGELVPTTHTAFWEEGAGDSQDEAQGAATETGAARATDQGHGALSTPGGTARPDAYDHESLRGRVTARP